MDESRIDLGSRYRDAVTGYTGVATSRTEYLQGCFRIQLERLDENGKPEGFAFDEPNLEFVDVGVLGTRITDTGGPHDHTSIVDRH